MKFKLREEQILCIEESRKSLKKEKRTILCLGTGGGKTVTASSMIQAAAEKGRRVWVLCHREEILFQFLETLMAFGLSPNLVCAGHKYLRGQQVHLCMIKTFQVRGLLSEVGKDDLVVVDECHWGDYEKTVAMLPCYVLGLSATPISTGRPLNEYWGDCIMPVSMKWLIDNGRLVNGITYSIDYDFSNLRVSGRDYSERLLLEEFKSPKLFRGAVDQYLKHAAGRKAFCYNINVEHSLETCKMFNDAGIRAAHIDGTTPRELRRDYFRSFRAGNFDILCNVGVATTGTDEPSVSCIIKNYCTVVLSKDKQCEGRGSRLFQGKENSVIIDMGRNYVRHGRYGVDEVDWISIYNDPKLGRKTRGRDREKECKECGAVIEMTAGKCAYCGCEYTKEEVEKIFLEKADTTEIKDYKLQKLPPHIRNKKIGHMSKSELEQYANVMGYNPKWVGMQIGLKKKYFQKRQR